MRKIIINVLILTCLLAIFLTPNVTLAETNIKTEQQHKEIFEKLKAEAEEAEINNLKEIDSIFNPIVEKNNIVQPNALVLSTRDAFKAGGLTLSKIGYPYTGALMVHSAQAKPSQLSFQKGSKISNSIKGSSVFKDRLKSFTSNLPKNGKYYSESGSFSLTSSNSSKDLYLALHKVKYFMAAEKKNGVWTIYTNIADTYDFQYWNKGDAPNVFVQLANNYGALAMESGEINPFNVNVYIVNTK